MSDDGGARPGKAWANLSVAAVWGFAEATTFFAVPDVWTSRIALRRPRRAAPAVFAALAGAVVGGTCTRAWAARLPAEASQDAMVRIPGVHTEMVRGVETEMARRGWTAMVLGPARGVPYKLYARTAGVAGLPLGPFLGWSVVARLPRFAVVTAGVCGLGALARRVGIGPGAREAVFWTGWGAFYTWYFTRGPGAAPREAPRAPA